jgi:hypothetical protein
MKRLIVFDYSGTLSLEAPLFAETASLMQQLHETGLEEFGVDSPGVFWEQIVNPTWPEGSMTSIGYEKLLYSRVSGMQPPDISGPRQTRMAKSVASFVERYFNRSRIDELWRPVLQRIHAHPSVRTVIATDHYAEASSSIIGFLKQWRMNAATAAEAALSPRIPCFIIANSADIGVHKTESKFWQILKTTLQMEAVGHILIVDDFGANEQSGDAYSKKRNVEARMNETVLTLKAVFAANIEVFSFTKGMNIHGHDVWAKNLIDEASVLIDRFLTAG